MTLTPPPAHEIQPTRWQALVFRAKATLLRLRRRLYDPHGRPGPLPFGNEPAEGTTIAESRSPLYPSVERLEFALQAGKAQNLRVAARFLHGRVLRAGGLFSFWANVPRPAAARGFARGRELRAGCVIPSVGGGLCQLSNALYDAALTAGFEIVERHAHSRSVAGSTTPPGRDATIFWNYVDLRFRAPVDCRFEVELTRSELLVRFRTLEPLRAPRPAAVPPLRLIVPPPAESCETCGVTSCFRNPSIAGLSHKGSTAWLVDAWTPEHSEYLARHRTTEDRLLSPLDSRRWTIGPYRWPSDGFASVRSAPLFVLRRSLLSRRSRAEGAQRQRALLRMDSLLAEIYARRIPNTALHVVVSQNLLPFLWQSGALGGRTFDVFMTRMPLAALQEQLDRAAARWPGTPTLGDFRADPALVSAESAALAEARHWITPHTGIARLGGARSVLLEWQRPPARARSAGKRLVFPASTLSRKGARELREALLGTNAGLTLGGRLLEGDEFWDGIETQAAGEDWLAGAAAAVLPAWVEHQPRRLLAALAAGVPVICTSACGLPPQEGLTIVPEGDPAALRTAIAALGLGAATGSILPQCNGRVQPRQSESGKETGSHDRDQEHPRDDGVGQWVDR